MAFFGIFFKFLPSESSETLGRKNHTFYSYLLSLYKLFPQNILSTGNLPKLSNMNFEPVDQIYIVMISRFD